MGRLLRLLSAWFQYRLRHGLGGPRPNAFDLEFDTDTVVAGEAVPLQLEVFDRWLTELPLAHPDFTLIHVGSGAGRLLLFASRYPFARIIGLESDPALVHRAERNLAIWEGPARARAPIHCNQIHTVHAEAATWPLPPVPSVFVVLPSFPALKLAAVAAHVRASLAASPREVYVLHAGARGTGLWEAAEDFVRVGEAGGARVYRWCGLDAAR